MLIFPDFAAYHYTTIEKGGDQDMRHALLAALLLALLTVLLPRALPVRLPADKPPAESPDADITATLDEPAPEDTPAPADEPEEPSPAESDSGRVVTALIGGTETKFTLQDYLIGVVAAEMPASFEPEALAAQAIAARTYTLYKQQVAPSPNHAQDVCDDINCCKAYLDEEALRERWGADYSQNLQKITAAVTKTDGQVMVYAGEPILAVFHSSSGSTTESSENVWGTALPYLVSVESPEESSSVPDHISEVSFSAQEFRELFLAACPEAELGEEPADWFSSLRYTDGGRLGSLLIGGVELRGTELRALLGLRSADISLRVVGDEIVFRVVGYGHGAGMSQYGANALALTGADAEEILTHYYPGAQLERLPRE